MNKPIFEIIKVYKSLRAGPESDVTPRLVKIGKKTYIDIREFVNSESYKGFTKKGICLSFDDLQTLAELLPQFLEDLDNT